MDKNKVTAKQTETIKWQQSFPFHDSLKCKRIKLPVKWHRVGECMKNHDPAMHDLWEILFRLTTCVCWQWRMRTEQIPGSNQKKAGVTLLLSDEIHFRSNTVETKKSLCNYERFNLPGRCINYKYYPPSIGAPTV